MRNVDPEDDKQSKAAECESAPGIQVKGPKAILRGSQNERKTTENNKQLLKTWGSEQKKPSLADRVF